MGINEKESPIRVNGLYNGPDGVTYFKLKSTFPGDYTKNCGLLGEEIDNNFYFLRGYDIESIDVDDKGNLVIRRVNKELSPIVVNIDKGSGIVSIKFDRDHGVILITYSDGRVERLEGFAVEGYDNKVATDSSISGDGSMYNPLGISDIEVTGTFAPVEEYFDLTDGSSMPEARGKGYRVITKEKIDRFGRLYTITDVEKIDNVLKETGSQWRVASKEDWDGLLNSLECEEDRNHGSNKNSWLGKRAGSALKSTDMWESHEVVLDDILTEGQDVVGMSIYPLGLTPDRNAIINAGDNDVEGFGQIAGMWTSTKDDSGNAYVKLFAYNSAQVDQDTYGEGGRMSIRLVKDYNYNNYNEVESILGLPYTTELIHGDNYIQIWTKENVYFEGSSLNGIVSDEWLTVDDKTRGIKEVYFINEWNGFEWHKKLMKNGDSTVIVNHNNVSYHEWRIIDGELVDTIDAIMGEFNNELTNIYSHIEKESQERISGDEAIKIGVNEKVDELRDHDNALKNEIEVLRNQTALQDKILKGEISKERELRNEEDRKIKEIIDNEINLRETSDSKIITTINKEITERTNSDNAIREKISKEIEDRVKADEAESMIRESNDNSLKSAIESEKLERESSDLALKEEIVKEYNRAYLAEKEIRRDVDSNTTNINDLVIKHDNLQTQVSNNVVKIHSVKPSSSNILEEYSLINAKGEILGDNIKIYKDSSLISVKKGHEGAIGYDEVNKQLIYGEEQDINHEFLYLIYRDANGVIQLVALDFENFVLEAEFGNGLQVNNHTAEIKIKSGEKYLNVDIDGLYTMGIDNSINEAVKQEENRAIEAESKLSEDIVRIDDILNTIDETITTGFNNVANEIERVENNVSSERDRAIGAETNIMDNLSNETKRAIEAESGLTSSIIELNAEIVSNKVQSKDIVVDKTDIGTNLTIQVDNKTITKVANAQGVYDSNVAIFGTLLNIKKVNSSNNAIKSRYELQDGEGNILGDAIELPVESALIDVKQGHVGDVIDPQTGNYITEGEGDVTMNFVYRLSNGTYELMQIIVSDYFNDAHFGRGLNNQDGYVSLVEGDGNEYLVIGEDTISVVGVNKAIEASKDFVIEQLNNEVNTLNNKINDLESKLQTLQTDFAVLKSTLDTRIQQAILKMIKGVENEIKVSNSDNIIHIGFADNAIFGEIKD